MAIYLPKLKEWLISNFALELFCKSQISNQTIVMSNLGKALIILGLAIREIDLNNPVCFMKLVISLLVSLLPLDCK